MTAEHFVAERPKSDEYNIYYDRYISLVQGRDVLAALEAEHKKTLDLLGAKSEADGDLRYAPDKWSVKEVLGHMVDTERIMSYRALRIARNDKTPIEGYEQDDYIKYGPFRHCRLADLSAEFSQVRAATLSLFRGLDAEHWTRRGTANKFDISVRALAFVIAGHEVHHRSILEQKYFSGTR